MALIHVDLRLSDVEFELWALEEHLAALEESVTFLKAQDRIRTEARLREQGLADDEGEIQIALQEHDQRVNHVLPRYLRGSFLVALWAVFEAAVRDIADHLRHQKSREFRLGDLHGNILDSGQKYFKHVLERELLPGTETAERLTRALILRNAYAHANGRLDAVYERDLPKIKKWIEGNVGVSEDHGFISGPS